MLSRCWTEISYDTIVENYKICEKLLQPGQKIMAIVKADAYGHGDMETARALHNAGCENFAVSNINEARLLRMAGTKGQILILGYTPPENFQDLYDNDITQAMLSEDYAEKMALSGLKLKAQFAIDTGMNRIGIDADNPAECERIIRRFANKFELTGLFTHLCVADTPAEDEFTKIQIEKFKRVCESVADLKLPFIHCMNTAGTFRFNSYGNLVRVGISLYGLKPDYDNVIPEGIKPALSWKSVISMVKTVKKGESIGYGRTYVAENDIKVATIPAGYADGYRRELSNNGIIFVRGQKAKIVGRVCMDQFMADVTDISNVSQGDIVTLIGEGYTADDMANTIGTIGYEIVCGISKRVERRKA